MTTLRWLVLGVICAFTAPTTTNAQEEDFGSDFFRSIVRASWNLSASGGLTTSGRFLLQGPAGGGERALKRDNGFNLGAGVGMDVLPRVGLQLSYTYTSSDLAFRTDNGDGSNALDIDDVGTLRSHVAGAEIIRYMLGPRAPITPFGSVGFVATWWLLDDESAFVGTAGGSTQFRFGAIASLGVQLRLAERLSARFEAATASVRNPFSGNESFQGLGGVTIDEPTRVNGADFRAGVVYYFRGPESDRRERWGRRRGRRGDGHR